MVALVRDVAAARAEVPNGVELVPGDVTRPETVHRACEGIDGVFNCMGIYEQWLPDPARFEEVNAQGALTVITAARQAGASRAVHTSTFDVFHAETGGTLDETKLADYPKGTAYERSKQHAEELVLGEAQEGIEVVIVNPAGVYGPGPWASAGLDSGDARRDPAAPPRPAARRDDPRPRRRRRCRAPGRLRARRARRALHPRRRLRDIEGDRRAGGLRGRPRLGAADPSRAGCQDPGRRRGRSLTRDRASAAARTRTAPLPPLAGRAWTTARPASSSGSSSGPGSRGFARPCAGWPRRGGSSPAPRRAPRRHARPART